MSHSPEPTQFTVDRGTPSQLRIVCGDKIIALLPVADGRTYEATAILAERIAAAVNACRGIPTEVLNDRGVEPSREGDGSICHL